MRSRYDDYEDLDEYEEDGDDQEVEDGGEDEHEEYEAEEAPKPEVLDYLELRQRLKEEKRKKLKKECGTLNGSMREKRNTKDGYGSFFGPSQPAIASRVIQESKSLLERASMSERVIKSNQSGNKSSGSAMLAKKSQASVQKPKVTNGLQTKVQLLKNTRDYSFLLSDDAEVPVPKKEPPRNFSAQKPEVRPAQMPDRNKGSLSNGSQKVFSAHENKKASAPVNRMHPKVGAERASSGVHQVRASSGVHQVRASSGVHQVRASSGVHKVRASSGVHQVRASSGVHKVRASSGVNQVRASSGVNQVRASTDTKKHLGTPNGTLVDTRKPVSSSYGSGPGRPVVTKTVPSKAQVGVSEKKVNVPVSRTPAPVVQRPAPSKSHPPVSRQSLSKKEKYRVSEKPKLMQKPTNPAPKPKQEMRPPPKTLVREKSRELPRKKPVNDDDDDDDDPISMIRNMFGYNPKKYEDDVDDRTMVVGFDTIMREEKRSEKIGRREDEEELLKIEEEERRERMRREAKKRKLSHR